MISTTCNYYSILMWSKAEISDYRTMNVYDYRITNVDDYRTTNVRVSCPCGNINMEQPCCDVHGHGAGPNYYGIDQLEVKRLIQEMPGARDCACKPIGTGAYQWKDFSDMPMHVSCIYVEACVCVLHAVQHNLGGMCMFRYLFAWLQMYSSALVMPGNVYIACEFA